MIYLDTSVIIAFVDEADPNHSAAVNLLDSLGEGEERAVSRLTLVELSSVYSRAGLENPVALAMYSTRLAKARVVDVNFDDVLRQAFTMAPRLRLRTLDLLHLVACKEARARAFATLDRDVKVKAEAVREHLGVEVISP